MDGEGMDGEGVSSSSFVDEILKDSKSFKSIEVEKCVDPIVDLGNLLLEDREAFDSTFSEADIDARARDNVQYLLNEIWKLPTERVEDVIVVKLSKGTTRLPREKPIPKQLPKTRWAEFAKLKGIRDRKKGRKVWDEVSQSWKPTWGYQRANDATKDWLIEIPDQKDPNKDYFGQKIEAKKERTAKNELKRLRNLHKGTNKGISFGEGIGMANQSKSPQQLSKLVAQTRKATASVGKFTETLPKEKPPKSTGKKRKFAPNEISSNSEKEKQLEILKRLDSKKPTLNVEKAISYQNKQENSDNKKMQTRKPGSRQKQRSSARNMKKHGRNRNITGQKMKRRTKKS